MPLEDVQVLFFDVFGTVVDYLNTVTKALKAEIKVTQFGDQESANALQSYYDWQHFTVEWRKGYMQETRRLASIGNPDKITVDQMHLTILNRLMASLPIPPATQLEGSDDNIGEVSREAASKALGQAWSPEIRSRLNMIWHALEPWPDSVGGLEELRKRFQIGTLTNGNLHLMVDMARNGRLPWDFILTADLLGSFKPDPQMYKKAMALLNINPETQAKRACLVAAHLYDCQAAKQCGMVTVFVSGRESEDSLPETGKPDYVDLVVRDLVELARITQGGTS